MDAKTLIHVGAEIIVIGGVSFWFHKRIGDQNAIITKLVDDNKKLHERVDALEQTVHHLIQLLNGQQHVHSPQQHHPSPPPVKPPSQPPVNGENSVQQKKMTKNDPVSNAFQAVPATDSETPPQPKSKVKRKPKPSSPPAKVEEIEDIDALLAEEIVRVENERNNNLKTSNEESSVSETSINDGEIRTNTREYVEDGTTDLPYSSN